MSKRRYGTVSRLMLLAIIFQLISMFGVSLEGVFASSKVEIINKIEYINGYKNSCNYDSKLDIPDGVAPCNKNNYKFNHDLYYKDFKMNESGTARSGPLKLIVYGDYNVVPDSSQTFKKGYQTLGDRKVIEDQGHSYAYAAKYGGYVYGEYRYLGYSLDGNIYSNPYFIADKTTSTDLADKHWVYNPWESLPSSYSHKPKTPGSVYEKYDNTGITQDIFNNVKKNLQRSIGFNDITAGVRYADRYKVNNSTADSKDVRNYMAVTDYPTTLSVGSGTMYHFSWVSNQMWYQTFPLEPLAASEKKSPPATCKIEVIGKQPVPVTDKSIVDVQVKVTGTLNDKDLDENLNYTREDIKEWQLQVDDFSGKPQKQKVDRVKNTGSHTFTVPVDVAKLQPTSDSKISTYKMKGQVQAVYYNGSAAAPSTSELKDCEITIKFDTPLGNKSMNSSFNVVPEIVFIAKSQFKQRNVGYADLSIGKDVDYYTFTITNQEDGTSQTKTFDPAIPGVKSPKKGYLDEATVEKWIYDFAASKFSESATEKVVKSFDISQTIIDKDSTVNNTSVALRTMVVVQDIIKHIEGTCDLIDFDKLVPVPQYVTPETNWPFDWYDQVPMPVTDDLPKYIPAQTCKSAPSYGDFNKKIFVEGEQVDTEEFLNGEYIFGENNLGIKLIEVQLTAPDGTVSFKKQHIVVHESKPRVSLRIEGNYKQNRTMRAIDTSSSSNDQWVEQTAPLEITSFSYVDPTDDELNCRVGYCEDNKSMKMYMYEEMGFKQLSIAAKRVIPYGKQGKSMTFYSDPYLVDYEILKDHAPAIIAHSYGNEVSRIDNLNLYYDVQSTDGDFISEKRLEVYYDTNNDGTFDKKVYETTEQIEKLPTFDKLGQYKIVAYAKEGTNQDRLMEFFTNEDYQTKTIESFFFVDNYSPAADIYLEVPYEMPKMDVYFLLDANLKQPSTDYIRNNMVGLTNKFTTSSILANVGIWDQKTYTYYQDDSTSRGTGGSYPAMTITHTNKEGYSGTMNRTSVSNSPYSVDEGQYKSVTDSKTGTGSCSNTVTSSYGPNGGVTGSTNTSMCPGSQSYDDGSYKGSIGRTGESASGSCPSSGGPPNGSCSVTWTASYAGTVYWTRDVWEPKMVSYNSYTGFYAGTLAKDIRQLYDASFLSEVKSKYVIYVSDGNIKDLSDLEYLMSKQKASLILVGSDAIISQIKHDHFFNNNKAIEPLVDDVIAYIAESNPAVPKVYKVVGDEINSNTASFDYEDDDLPAIFDQLQIIQDPYFFDNTLGFDKYNGKALITEMNASNWSQYQQKVIFTKPGKYTFTRRIKDLPSTDPNFEHYSYYSNEAAIEVYVHRRPIAEMELDFDYNPDGNVYKTKWLDHSYDLDHNVTRAATDRGIQDSSLKFTHIETGEVFTVIPTELIPGTYKLELIVQDIEGEWSDPYINTYVLPNAVPVQFKSNLKTAYNGFSLNSIPANESLVAYELWTRYPYSVSLNLKMGTYINKNVPYYTGTKVNNDINWANETLVIPPTTPDGLYTFNITANGSVAGSTATNNYSVKVVTPINLSGSIDSEFSKGIDSLVVSDNYDITAKTTKYPHQVSVELFKGTSYRKTLNLTGTTTNTVGYGQKKWTVPYTMTSNVPNGMYTVEWTATTPNGNVERVSQQIEVTRNRPPVSQFVCTPNPAYEGDNVNCKNTSYDPDGDSMTFLWTVTGPKSYSATFTTTDIVIPKSVTENRIGDYNITLRAIDERGKVNDNDAKGIVKVLPLSIEGAVNHTPEWEANRLKWNDGNPDSQRPADTYWAGEGFDLVGKPTETSNEGGSTTVASKVEVVANYVGTKNLSWQTAARWTGYLGQEHTNVNLEKLSNGAYDFVFTVTYSNGVIKTDTVRIYILNNWLEYFRFHKDF